MTGEEFERKPSRLKLIISQPGETRFDGPVSIRVERCRRLTGLVPVQMFGEFADVNLVVDNCLVERGGGGCFGRSSTGFRAL